MRPLCQPPKTGVGWFGRYAVDLSVGRVPLAGVTSSHPVVQEDG